ncbi:Thioredoxin reductase [Labilithrix luteola]|uniref:Thioredoxin reductase n=1 Tax=Labilithrix luteola TaxID=1391654 RepID=A0A0K1Q4G1_9BACT|nr:class I SAM-dependent methyltransferase [Labilithrix luteola]AKV00270.1 Thioredoxin reductase [Labilithrix luteola]
MSEAEDFWERRWREMAPPRALRPSPVMVSFVAELEAGRALDLGCARGDDAIWLATRGWRVTAVDIATSALVAARARSEGLAIDYQQHDLGESFPEGEFDLVSAQYLQSPVAFPRARVLQRAARAVARGGLLLVVEHASHRPWGHKPEHDVVFPPAEELAVEIGVEPAEWCTVFLGRREREAKGPNGEIALVADNIVAFRRTI